MPSRRLIFRYVVVSLSFVLLYLLLNRPEVILLSRIGFVAWYPAIGLVMALLLGVNPWFALLAGFADVLAGKLIYLQPVISFSNAGALGIACCYGSAAHVLRARLQIDLELRRRQDIVRYVFMSAIAAAAATAFGVGCLIADHSIAWNDARTSAVGWFLGDAIGLVGIAPFLLVHVFPQVRTWLSPSPTRAHSSKANSSGMAITFGALAEASGQALAIVAVLLVMFGSKDRRYDHFYL